MLGDSCEYLVSDIPRSDGHITKSALQLIRRSVREDRAPVHRHIGSVGDLGRDTAERPFCANCFQFTIGEATVINPEAAGRCYNARGCEGPARINQGKVDVARVTPTLQAHETVHCGPRSVIKAKNKVCLTSHCGKDYTPMAGVKQSLCC